MESTPLGVVWHHGNAVYGIGRRPYVSADLLPYNAFQAIPCRRQAADFMRSKASILKEPPYAF